MAPVNFRPFSADDLKNPAAINDRFREVVDAINALQGVHGPIQLLADLNLSGNRIKNVGAATEAGDALNQTAADPLYSTAVQQTAMEAVGANMLQTTRRLNDGTQQHQISSDLNAQGSVPPTNIAGSLTYTSVVGASITWTWTGIIITWADGSQIAVRNGVLAVTGLINTTYQFFPYYDTQTGLLTFVADNTNAHGSPPVAFISPTGTSAAAQSQNSDTRVALTTAAAATANGGGGTATLRAR
jgi:hypothetical protein